jgi:hypothetical protein
MKENKGDMWTVIRHALSELQKRGVLNVADKKNLELSFGETLDVLANKRVPSEILGSTRRRYASMVADHNSSDVARALAELCQSVIMDRATSSATAQKGASKAAARVVLSGAGEQALFWGAIGAAAGAAIGGPLGGLIGAGLGAAFGACTDGDTTVTPTNNGGGSPA